jgi:flagellar M-ring protein FliF
MDQIKKLFRKLTWQQRIWVAAAAVAVIGGITTLAHWNQERDYKPLFSGLAAEDAGALLPKLKESGVDYRLTDNGSTILVPSERVAEMRLQMAAAGLPKTGRIGFELFDKTNFGASEFTEQVNYHRAIEGELERSVMSIREVEEARVHVTMAKDSLYTEARQSAKASVLVKLRTATPLSPQNVAAICQLTASAVPGLLADQVTVVDTNGNLLNRPKASSAGNNNESSEAALEYRKGVEHDVQNKVAATLEPLLGPDHFRVGVSADVDLSSGEQSEETFDPAKSVMVTSQTTQDGPALPWAMGVPGTASNVPVPASRPTTGASNYARHTENISYQSSRLVKHTLLPQGTVKRLSMSVLVDHSVRWEGSGDKLKRVIEAPSADKLKVIRGLVAAATGLDATRGDQLVVEAFPFESTLTAGQELLSPTAAPVPPGPGLQLPAWLEKFIRTKPKVAAGIGAGTVLLLIAVVGLAWWRRGKGSKARAEMAASLAAGHLKPLGPEELQHQLEGRLADEAAELAKHEMETLMKLKGPAVVTKKTDVLTKHIAAEAKTNPTAMAQVVRTWLSNG